MVKVESATNSRGMVFNIAMIGNPNTGKSTLFNALSGLRTRVGNFPGVTVEKKVASVTWGDLNIDLIDLPGTYSLAARTPDEMVAVDVLLGRQSDIGEIGAVICVIDSSNLERNLYLASQVHDIGLPMLLVLNMEDVAANRGVQIDQKSLAEKFGATVVSTTAHRRQGLDELKLAVSNLIRNETPPAPHKIFPDEFYAQCQQLTSWLGEQSINSSKFLVERLILDPGGAFEQTLNEQTSNTLAPELSKRRQELNESGFRIPAGEAMARYGWIRDLLTGTVRRSDTTTTSISDRVDKVLTHRFMGVVIFAAIMFVVFQAIFTWAEPFMGLIESGQEWLSGLVIGLIAPGPLRSLLVDGAIAGVGGVIVFLPQIVFLFLFIALLEDCGYMARAAFLMDKLMTKIGLSGKSFVPMMSSFACAIPGVMATRVIENRRDRMTTIMVAPLMSCSARLPVYLLMFAAFFPHTTLLGGWVRLQTVVIFDMYLLGILVAIPVAWILKKTFFKGETPPFVMELPSYKWPSPTNVFNRVYDRSKAFVVRAGTLIFATSILIWVAGYYPGDHGPLDQITARVEQIESQSNIGDEEQAELEQLNEQHNVLSSELIAGSWLGKMGHAIEPAVKPLGWDWRIGVGAIASFPAREVIISTLGTIYSLGGDVDEEDTGLISSLRAATWPDGRKVFNIPVALSVMVFFALCAQCAATLMIVKRETNSWRWPIFMFTYMTGLAYVSALITYQVAIRLV